MRKGQLMRTRRASWPLSYISIELYPSLTSMMRPRLKPLDLVRHDGVDTSHVWQLARVIDGIQAKQPILFAERHPVSCPHKLRLGVDGLGPDPLDELDQIRMPISCQDGNPRLTGDIPQSDERVWIE